MIRAIISDIDGVLVGTKIGINAPHPHPKVIERLRSICKKGIPVCLCTSKPFFSIEKIVHEAKLDNPHVVQGGAVVMRPDGSTVVSRDIPGNIAENFIAFCLEKDIYAEVYSGKEYFVDEKQNNDFAQKHAMILEHEPILTAELSGSAKRGSPKIILIAKDVSDKDRVNSLVKPFAKSMTFHWSVHPAILPLQFCIVTAQGVSKRNGIDALSEHLNIPLVDFLGLGDTMIDWEFIQDCGYAATLKNGTDELRKSVSQKKNSFIAPSVDENGALAIFDHFLGTV